MKRSIQIEIDGGCPTGVVYTIAAKIRGLWEIHKVVYVRDMSGNRKLMALCDSEADMDATLEDIQRLPHVTGVSLCNVL